MTLASVAAAQKASSDHVNAALDLPRQVDTLRARGVPESQTRLAINEFEKRRVPATESRNILIETNTDAKAHGPVNNFGAFVQSQLAAGKRGTSLAAAIRAEHLRRGSKVHPVSTASKPSKAKGPSVKPAATSKKAPAKVVTKSSSKAAASKPTGKPAPAASASAKGKGSSKSATKKPTTPPTSRGRP
ncbi:MAG TPA: hypothetical protein VJ867_04305 [Gemmatimonadaceae bacterium]|nr:hypothetical protein [Gemmatimonadaceae bacterium]